MNYPIKIYTDGSALSNPGRGGYAAILTYQGHEKELSGGFRLTTNNRMELLAVIKGLEAIKKRRQEVIVYADSRYVVNAVTQRWVMGWEKKGFEKKKNADLWKRFLAIYRCHNVKMVWVEAHAGHHYNERCDLLAKKSASKGPWQVDHVYENLSPTLGL
ncbi:MAG: ribonuclease HI [Bacteroidota bacterium]